MIVVCTHKLDATARRAEFRQLLAAGDRDVVYSVIKWVLSQGHLLEKKAFVGFYLSFPEVGGTGVVTGLVVEGCCCAVRCYWEASSISNHLA